MNGLCLFIEWLGALLRWLYELGRSAAAAEVARAVQDMLDLADEGAEGW